MSTSNEVSKDHNTISEQSFFQYFYSYSYHPKSIWKTLKEKYRGFKQQSYATPKPAAEINYIRRFTQVCYYVPFVPQIRPEKIDIPILQQIIQIIYDEHEEYFANGGWRAVKNKSLKTHIQQHLLLKLWRFSANGKVQGRFGNFILEFFYTLNYFKTCNYEIKLFNYFLMSSQLDYFFLFIVLRKKSRRINKDLILKSQHIAAFVEIIKGERNSNLSNIYNSEHEELGQVKLLLIYPELVQYIQNNGVVLHEIMLLSLMECAQLSNQAQKITYTEPGSIDWAHFLSVCFKKVGQDDKAYQKELLSKMMEINLQVADSLFKPKSTNINVKNGKNESEGFQNIRQKYLEQSFGWLIGAISSIIYASEDCDQRLRKMYIELEVLFEYNLSLGNKLIYELLKSPQYYSIYCKYQGLVKAGFF